MGAVRTWLWNSQAATEREHCEYFSAQHEPVSRTLSLGHSGPNRTKSLRLKLLTIISFVQVTPLKMNLLGCVLSGPVLTWHRCQEPWFKSEGAQGKSCTDNT